MNTEQELPPVEGQQPDTNTKQELMVLLKKGITFLRELLDIREDTDRDQTIEDIKKDIPFKGHTAWILIFAVFIASIGLNVSSTAVVIGAMLISPLMGPILGVGLSLAIYDIDTLKRSLINLGVMVGLSVLTAWLYFWLSPLTEETPELVARTAPTILDVLIAIFGGFALIIAKSKKGTMASVIFGVAIATALMPPLCTVGYGLAIGDATFYLGGLYLFTINTIFIALATFVVAKILGFPLVKYANIAKRNRIKWTVIIIALLAIIPASYTFYTVLEETSFNVAIKTYIKKEIKSNNALQLLDYEADYSTKTIHLSFYNEVAKATQSDLLNELKSYESLSNVTLNIKGSSTGSFELVKDLLAEKRAIIKQQRHEITALNAKINQIETAVKNNTIDFLQLSKDAKINFYELNTISYAEELQSNFKTIDTITVLRPVWNESVTDSLLLTRNAALYDWLKNELDNRAIEVRKND